MFSFVDPVFSLFFTTLFIVTADPVAAGERTTLFCNYGGDPSNLDFEVEGTSMEALFADLPLYRAPAASGISLLTDSFSLTTAPSAPGALLDPVSLAEFLRLLLGVLPFDPLLNFALTYICFCWVPLLPSSSLAT